MPPRLRTFAQVMLFAAVFVFAAGCKREEAVRTYTVAKVTAAEVRTLGAIIPTGSDDASWFVKFSGPAEVVTAHEKEFDAFLGSLRVTDGPRKRLEWTKPDGWRDGPAKDFRQVTFQTGPETKPVDMYVSDPSGGSVLENVNRWRKQIGAGEVGEADLASAAPEVHLAIGTVRRVDARGPGGKGGGMMPPTAQ